MTSQINGARRKSSLLYLSNYRGNRGGIMNELLLRKRSIEPDFSRVWGNTLFLENDSTRRTLMLVSQSLQEVGIISKRRKLKKY